MQHFLEVCEAAARAGGAELLARRGTAQVRAKAPRDLVTEADLAAQQAVFDIIHQAFPDHAIVGEEQLNHPAAAGAAAFRWLVDPLDGTTNFVHGLPYYGTSVALVENNQPIVGVVYNPDSGACYRATMGQGAYLNDAPIHVSQIESPSEALVAASFAAVVDPDSPEVRRFLSVLGHVQAIRRMGSAALNFCLVAAGRLDGYFATTCYAWDVAAGVLLVREAGGHIIGIEGQRFDIDRPQFIATGTETLQRELLRLMK